MERNRCYLADHDWRFFQIVEREDGNRYSLARCLQCGAEYRRYENGDEILTIAHAVAWPTSIP